VVGDAGDALCGVVERGEPFRRGERPPHRQTPPALGDSITGWTPAFRDRKIAQLASVIAQMNNGAGPDLLGVCEVENRHVLDMLVAELAARLNGRAYQLVHSDTADARVRMTTPSGPTLLV
jgi:hypothetical protein